MRAVIALGGNALRARGESFEFEHQAQRAFKSLEPLARLISEGHEIAITHGNGPQVGMEFFRNVLTKHRYPVFPMDALNASTQGWIGYALEKAIRAHQPQAKVATLVCMVEVRENDPAFENPTKPIGEFFDEGKARELSQRFGWAVKQDATRGWRVVVPSPRPVRVLSTPGVETLLDAGFVVITAGGGGIPVVRKGQRWRGVFAVIDKDRASALLALEVKADKFVILTGVDAAYLRFGQPDQEKITKLTVSEAKELLAQGHFPPGSMGPKIEAASHFAQQSGKPAVISSLDSLSSALRGEAGTTVVPD